VSARLAVRVQVMVFSVGVCVRRLGAAMIVALDQHEQGVSRLGGGGSQ
jgi:hypothetical protein